MAVLDHSILHSLTVTAKCCMLYTKYLKLHFDRTLVMQSKKSGRKREAKMHREVLTKYLACTDLPNIQVQRAPEAFLKS